MTKYSMHAGQTLPSDRLNSLQGVVNSSSSFDISHIYRPSSDCGGSSSGLGGMTKTDIVSSDSSSLAGDTPADTKSSQWVPPHPMLVNNNISSVYMACNFDPTSSAQATVYPDPGRTCFVSSNSSIRAPVTTNDLFVHVQTGETLSILVGSNVQHISGPATVRMVNQAGVLPSALPLHVPPGHMVQQIVDEQGVLRHLILSPETSPSNRLISVAAPPVSGARPSLRNSGSTLVKSVFSQDSYASSVSQSFVSPSMPYAVRTDGSDFTEEPLRRSWTPQGRRSTPQVNGGHLIHMPMTTPDDREHSQSGASGNEDEEWERLTEMLSRMQAPQVLRVAAKEADICWQELDTSEASAPGGPFPQIDASEFTYEIVLSENVVDGRGVSRHRCAPASGNRVRLCQLRPNTDYFVYLRASLEERGLQGNASSSVKFRTLCSAPECPSPPRCLSRTHNSVVMAWRPPCDNGSAITQYRLEIAKESYTSDHDGPNYVLCYEGISEQAQMNDLSPSTRYRFRLCATNAEGSSPYSSTVFVHTAHFEPPKSPKVPQLVSLSSKAIKISWDTLPNHSYTLEMSDSSRTNGFNLVCERTDQSSANINDLLGNRQYYFRLVAHNEAGNSEPSETLVIRTPPSPTFSAPPLTPSHLYVISSSRDHMEIGWKPGRTVDRDCVNFILEGSCDEENWDLIYKGTAKSALVKDNDFKAFRVSATKKQAKSGWSDILRVEKQEKKRKVQAPEKCRTPTFSELPPNLLRVKWIPHSSMAPLTYQLRRVNVNPPSTLYQGELTMFDVTDCSYDDVIEVQVRALTEDQNGILVEGEWSNVAVGRLCPRPPHPPSSVRLKDDGMLEWNAPNDTKGAPITEYIVERNLIFSLDASSSNSSNAEATCESSLSDWTVMRLSATEFSVYVGNGRPGCKYEIKIFAVNIAGKSVPSECVLLTIPSTAPCAPPILHLTAEGCSQLQLVWGDPCTNGSKIQGYVIKVFDEKLSVEPRCSRVAEDVREYLIDSLEANHTYSVSIAAVSDLGESAPSLATGTTLAPPPLPPEIFCSESGSNYLKLKWKAPITSNSSFGLYYYLEKGNENGKFSPVYEGDNRYAKVRNLNENTTYRFRMRCSSKVSGAGPWSEPFEFTTEQLPPPTIRSAPVVNEIARGSFQVEWSPLRCMPAPSGGKESIFYRLQLAPRSALEKSSGAWRTIYEGLSTSYSLSCSESVQLRVQTVRLCNGMESVSAPSAVQYATPTIPTPMRKNSVTVSKDVILSSEDISNLQWVRYHLVSDKHYACFILAIFVGIAFAVALLLEAFIFDLS